MIASVGAGLHETNFLVGRQCCIQSENSAGSVSQLDQVAVGSVLAVYFAVFGLIDAKSTQEETRASVEQSLFMILVSSSNAASFEAAMREFGPIQAMLVTEHPSWLKFLAVGLDLSAKSRFYCIGRDAKKPSAT